MATSAAKPYRLTAPLRGVRTRKSHSVMADGSYAMLRNVEMARHKGVFHIRQGTQQKNSSSLGATPIRGAFRWKAETYFGHGTSLYRLNNGVPASIGSGFTSDLEWYFAATFDRLYATNGGAAAADGVQKYDGVSTVKAGFTAPTGAVSPAIVAVAGVLNGAYKYKYTFIYSSGDLSQESSASPESISVSPVNQQVDLSSFQAGPTGAVWMNIYRTKAGDSKFYFHSKVAVNPGAPIRDNLPDSSLGLTQAPTDNGVPPKAKFIWFSNGRMFYVDRGASNSNRLWFSARSSTERNPIGALTVHGAHVEIVPASFYVDVGDSYVPITGLGWWGDALVIFKEDEIWLLRGNSPSDFVLINTGNAVGCVAPRTIVNMGLDQGLWFLGKGDTGPQVYAFGGMRAVTRGLEVEPTFREKIVGIGTSYLVQPSAGRYRRQYILSYAKNATPDYEFAICDTADNQYPWEFGEGPEPSCWVAYNEPGDAGELYFGHAKAGWIVQWDKNGGDFRTSNPSVPGSVTMVIETDWMNFGRPNQVKEIEKIWLLGTSQATATITVERRYDYRATGVTDQCNGVAMDPWTSGAGAFFKTIDGTKDTEIGYVMKLIITIVVPYTATGDPFKAVEISEVEIEYGMHEPV